MALGDIHAPIEVLFKCYFLSFFVQLYIAADVVSTDLARRAVSLQQLSCLLQLHVQLRGVTRCSTGTLQHMLHYCVRFDSA